MKKLRIVIAVIAFACMVVGIELLVVEPYRCNQRLKLAKRGTTLAIRESQPVAARLAQRNIDGLAPCTRWCESSVDALMVLAANERLLGRYQSALSFYDRAGHWDRRPELLFNRGMTSLEMGHRDSGLRLLVEAVSFNYSMLRQITNPTLRSEVHRMVVGDRIRAGRPYSKRGS